MYTELRNVGRSVTHIMMGQLQASMRGEGSVHGGRETTSSAGGCVLPTEPHLVLLA